MSPSRVRLFTRAVRRGLATTVLTLGAASALAAQATGKLEGRIRDQAGQPIANARIVIVGSTASATANPQGYYFINNVPAGELTIQVSYIGYKATSVTGIKMLSGQTITQDATLQQTIAEVTEITVVAAQNAMVPRDQVTSKQLMDGQFVDKLPVDRVGAVIALQPGVSASPDGGNLSIRGGRADDNTTYIDGVPVTPGNRGTGAGRSLTAAPGQAGQAPANQNAVGVGTNAFEDASVTTGASSAEFGTGQGGIIAITTRSGGAKLAGNVGYETDEFSGLRQSIGFNRMQASVGGPIAKDLTFFLGGTLEGSRTGTRGYKGWEVPSWEAVGVDTTYAVPKTRNSATSDTSYVSVYKYAMVRGECDNAAVSGASDADMRNNYGFKCQGNRNAYSPATTYQLTGKLNYSFGAGSRLALSMLSSRSQARGRRAADQTLGTMVKNNVATLNWTQTLSKSSSRAIALDAYLSYQWDRSIQAPLTAASEADSRDPFNGWMLKDLDFQYGFQNFEVTDALIRNYRLQRANTAITVLDRDNAAQYAAQTAFGGAPDGVGVAAGGGGAANGTLATAMENRLIGKANLDWQLDRYNRLKVGGEYTKYKMATYNVGATGQAFSDIWLAKPTRYNVFAEDRLDLGDVVLVGGLRYDYFKINADKWKEFPRISSTPGFDADALANFLEPYKAHDYLSPHIQVAFPVTEKTNFRLSYAQQVQQPDFSVALFGSNTDLSITNTNNNYGSDLDFGKSILFEFGVRHAFNDDMVLDVTVYNKDNLANPAGRLVPLIDPITNSRNDVRLTVNQDFGNTRGLDLRLDRRFGNIFNGAFGYSFQDARNTGSDPYTYINYGSRILSGLGGTNASPPQSAQPVGSSRPHNITGQAAFTFPADFKQGSVVGAIMHRVGIYSTFRYASGTPYTRCGTDDPGSVNVLSGAPCARELAGDFNAARLPAYKEFNLRVTKSFGLGKLDVTAYADARNLFNFKNISRVYTTTGTTVNATSASQAWTTDSIAFADFGNANGAYGADGSLTLPSTNAGCANYQDRAGSAAAPSCYYFRKSEQRFGNGDGVYSLAEQRRASNNNRLGAYHISNYTFAGRQVRFGMEVSF